MRLEFLTLDVFTDRPFGGNPLALFPDARGLDGAAMQAIATEFNLSETVFFLPPPEGSEAIATVRIFTPVNELPFAGHPNVGAAFHVATQGGIFGREAGDHFVFDEKAGAVNCFVDRSGGGLRTAIAAPKPLSLGDEIDVQTIAACASLDAAAIATATHPPRFVSVGLPFATAELVSLEALASARPYASPVLQIGEARGFSLMQVAGPAKTVSPIIGIGPRHATAPISAARLKLTSHERAIKVVASCGFG